MRLLPAKGKRKVKEMENEVAACEGKKKGEVVKEKEKTRESAHNSANTPQIQTVSNEIFKSLRNRTVQEKTLTAKKALFAKK